MGIPTKPTSFRFTDDTLRKISEMMDVFAPTLEFRTRTSTLQWLINVGHAWFVLHQGEGILKQVQRLLCTTPSLDSAAGTPESAGSVPTSLGYKHRPRVIQLKSTAVTRRYLAATEVGPFGTSFPAHRPLLFAGGQL